MRRRAVKRCVVCVCVHVNVPRRRACACVSLCGCTSVVFQSLQCPDEILPPPIHKVVHESDVGVDPLNRGVQVPHFKFHDLLQCQPYTWRAPLLSLRFHLGPRIAPDAWLACVRARVHAPRISIGAPGPRRRWGARGQSCISVSHLYRFLKKYNRNADIFPV